MIEAIDSFFMWHQDRWATINPARKVIFIQDAADWPPETIYFEAMYLLVLGDTPMSKPAQTAAIPGYQTTVQWQWLIEGTDLQDGIKGRNRGDRYRKNYAIKQELLKATFPHYCEKKIYTVASNNKDLVATSYSSPEMILWTPPMFNPHPIDKSSGVITGIATQYIGHWTDTITE